MFELAAIKFTTTSFNCFTVCRLLCGFTTTCAFKSCFYLRWNMAIRKTWYEIEAPTYFKEQIVGETPASDPKYLIGRVVSVSLADLQADARKFYLKFNFRIVNVDGKAKTIFIGHDITSEKIYRMVQRHSRRVDSIQDIQLADGSKIRVKAVLIIPKRVSTSVKDSVRKKMDEAIMQVVSEASMEEFISMLIKGTLTNAIRDECKKVYPVGAVEIRKSEVVQQPTMEAPKKRAKKDAAVEVQIDQMAEISEEKAEKSKKATAKKPKKTVEKKKDEKAENSEE